MLRHPQSELSYRLILIGVTHQLTDMMNLHGIQFCNPKNFMSSVSCCKMFYGESDISRTDITGNLKKWIAAGSEINHMFCHALYRTFYVSVLMESYRRTVPDYWNIHFNMYNSFIFRSTTEHNSDCSVFTKLLSRCGYPIHFLQRVFL